jgi:hypothetical protein
MDSEFGIRGSESGAGREPRRAGWDRIGGRVRAVVPRVVGGSVCVVPWFFCLARRSVGRSCRVAADARVASAPLEWNGNGPDDYGLVYRKDACIEY